jgi:flagella basal body P-ring formation protein FlgA
MPPQQLSRLGPKDMRRHIEAEAEAVEEQVRGRLLDENAMALAKPVLDARRALKAAQAARDPIVVAQERASAIANMDIYHKGHILGAWDEETNQALITDIKNNAITDIKNNAGKLIKRRIRKNKTKIKTKRRPRHKNTKRRRSKLTN